MMENNKQKFTLYRPATYQIKVSGVLGEMWVDWAGEMAVSIETGEIGMPINTMIGCVDQTALLSLLRRLYSLGLPLISVICVEIK
jgi:hypothetical protein